MRTTPIDPKPETSNVNQSSMKAYELLTDGTAADPEHAWTEALQSTSYGFEVWARERLQPHLDPGELNAVQWQQMQIRIVET